MSLTSKFHHLSYSVEQHEPHLLKGKTMPATFQTSSTQPTSTPPPGADTLPQLASTGSLTYSLTEGLSSWNNQWNVEDAVNAFNSNLMYGYRSVVASCEILSQSFLQWSEKGITTKSVDKVTKSKDRKTGKVIEKTKAIEVKTSDYDRLLKALGLDDAKGKKIVQRMIAIYQSSIGEDDERILFQLEGTVGGKDNLILPSTYTVLYEIATCDSAHIVQLKSVVMEKGLDLTAGDIRNIKNPKLEEDEDEDKFKVAKGEKLVVKGYITAELYQANEKAILAGLKQLESAGVHCDIPDYKKERKAEDAKAKKSADNRAYVSLRKYVLGKPDVKGFDTLPESWRKKMEFGTPIKDDDGKETGEFKPYGMTKNRYSRCIEKAIYDRDIKYKQHAQEDERKMNEISANTAGLRSTIRSGQGVTA